MKTTIFFPVLLLSIFFLSSCTGNAVFLKDNKSFMQTDPKNIRVYSVTDPSDKYEVLGYVSTYSSNAHDDGDLLKENLRKQASHYGATAIIRFKLNMGISGGGGAEGVAIRFLQ